MLMPFSLGLIHKYLEIMLVILSEAKDDKQDLSQVRSRESYLQMSTSLLKKKP
jgi:hypothetical protein